MGLAGWAGWLARRGVSDPDAPKGGVVESAKALAGLLLGASDVERAE